MLICNQWFHCGLTFRLYAVRFYHFSWMKFLWFGFIDCGCFTFRANLKKLSLREKRPWHKMRRIGGALLFGNVGMLTQNSIDGCGLINYRYFFKKKIRIHIKIVYRHCFLTFYCSVFLAELKIHIEIFYNPDWELARFLTTAK